jgi:hypothetical protein
MVGWIVAVACVLFACLAVWLVWCFWCLGMLTKLRRVRAMTEHLGAISALHEKEIADLLRRNGAGTLSTPSKRKA